MHLYIQPADTSPKHIYLLKTLLMTQSPPFASHSRPNEASGKVHTHTCPLPCSHLFFSHFHFHLLGLSVNPVTKELHLAEATGNSPSSIQRVLRLSILR